jgi:hypothetical protein
MGIAVRLIVCSALAFASASARAQTPGVDTAKFYSALSCRLTNISGGQRNTAVLFDITPDAVNRMRLIRINPDKPQSELETIIPRRSRLISGHAAGHQAANDRFYWTANDDFVIGSLLSVFLHLPARDISPGSAPRFDIAWVPRTDLFFFSGDVIPEHIRTAARMIGDQADRMPLQFELSTGHVSTLPVPVGSLSTLAWTENDDFVRLRNYSSRHLDVFDHGASAWVPFTQTAMPANSALVLVRNSPLDNSLETVIRWREQGIDRIGIVKRGAESPQVVASDKNMVAILVSPDRSRVYGFVDLSGRFHRVGTESQKPGVAFWLAQLEKTQAPEKIYFLGDDRFALIKATNPVAGPEIQLLERRGNSVAMRHTFCAGGSEVGRVAEGEHSTLFVPKAADTSKLIAYLHDGPFSRVHRGGDWIIDLLLASGHPVLAVNYTGSTGNEPARNDGRSAAETFGSDVARALAFADRELGSGDRRLVLVGEGLGALVGFFAISAGEVRPHGFATISGVTAAGHVYSGLNRFDSGFRPGDDAAAENLFFKAARQSGAALDPAKIRQDHPQLELLFVHGDKDERAPYKDIAEFVQELNNAGGKRQARLLQLNEMYVQTPHRRAHYDRVLEAVGEFLSRL